MRQLIAIYAIILLAIVSVAVVSAQDGTTVLDGQITELRAAVTVQYGDAVYELDAADGTVAIGFVESRTATTEGATLDIVLFAHDDTGWRSIGVVTGEATGPLIGAVPGNVVTLSVVGSEAVK